MSRSPLNNNSANQIQSDVPLREQIKSVPQNLQSLGITEPGLVQLLIDVSNRFFTRFSKASSHLKTPFGITQFEDSCKRRYKDLFEMVVSSKNALDDNIALTVIRKTSHGTRSYKYKYENKLQIIHDDDEDMVVYTQNVHPHCYTDLFRAAYSLINELKSIDDTEVAARKQILNSLLYIVSIGKIYENLRGSLDYNLKCETDGLASMVQVKEFDENSKEGKLICQVLDEITFYVENPKDTPKYLRGIVNSINSITQEKFSLDDYHISLKSTGVTEKGRKGAVPGLLASLVETDISYPQDKLIGYQSHYNKTLPHTFKEQRQFTMSVPQSKLKRRIIHIASNGIQDRCNYFHRILASIVQGIPSDCTFDQADGVLSAKDWTSLKHREANQNNVYSADISDATGTVIQRFQELVLIPLFGKELAAWYMEMVTHERKFRFVNNSEILYKQTMGQPQGFKGSFPLFALGHHIIVLAVMLACGLEDKNPKDFYRLIGDDIIISAFDPDCVILNTYIDMCGAINWTVHKSKGHYYYYNDPKSKPIAEFAKVTIVGGEIYTPIPIKLLLHNNGSASSQLQLASWSSRMVNPLDILEVLDLLQSTKLGRSAKFTDEYTVFLKKVRSLNLSDLLNDFTQRDDIEVSESDKAMIGLSVLRANVKATLVDQFIPDHLRDKPLEETIQIACIDKDFEDKYLNLLEDKEHKYFSLLQKNQNMIDALEEVFVQHPMLARAIIALKLKPGAVRIVFRICEVLIMDPESLLGQHDTIFSLIKRWEELSSSFQLRSIMKRTKKDSLLLYTTFQDYLRVCKLSHLYDEESVPVDITI